MKRNEENKGREKILLKRRVEARVIEANDEEEGPKYRSLIIHTYLYSTCISRDSFRGESRTGRMARVRSRRQKKSRLVNPDRPGNTGKDGENGYVEERRIKGRTNR